MFYHHFIFDTSIIRTVDFTRLPIKCVIATRPFTLHCMKPWGCVPNDPDTCPRADLINDILVNVRVLAATDRLTPCRWLVHRQSHPGTRRALLAVGGGIFTLSLSTQPLRLESPEYICLSLFFTILLRTGAGYFIVTHESIGLVIFLYIL